MLRNKKWGKWLCSMLAAGLLLGGITAAEAAVVTGSFDSRVYENRLDKFSTMRVYNVEGEQDVPYVSVQEYLTALYYGDVAFQVNAAGSGLTAVRNNTQVEFDVQKGSLRCSDWDAFLAPMVTGPCPMASCMGMNSTPWRYRENINQQRLRLRALV